MDGHGPIIGRKCRFVKGLVRGRLFEAHSTLFLDPGGVVSSFVVSWVQGFGFLVIFLYIYLIIYIYIYIYILLEEN